MSMMNDNYWIVGEIDWRDDTANVRIARTEAAARRWAEGELAEAARDWEAHGEEAEVARREVGGWVGRVSLDCYTDFVATKKWVGVFGMRYRSYKLLRDGIWLTGPNGERVHVSI